MSRFMLLIPAALLLVAANAVDELDGKDLKKLEGTWVMVSGERDGGKIAEEHVKKNKITWKGKDIVLESPHQTKETIKATLTRLDPTKKPAEMEWTRATGPEAGKVMFAIYEFIDDDNYRVCFALPGKDRPKEFSSKEGSGHFVHVWQRAKK